MRKTVSYLLLLSMILSVLSFSLLMVSCDVGGTGGGVDLSTDNVGNDIAQDQNNDENEGEQAEQELIRPNLPERNFEGMEVYFFTMTRERNPNNFAIEVFAEQMTGEVINDAVFRRNAYLEDRYNFVIREVLTNTTANAGDLSASIRAGDDMFQVLMLNIREAAAAAGRGYLLDLAQSTYIDLDMPWWDSQLNGDMSIGGRLFYAIGDMNLMANNATWATFFNKTLISDFALDSPFDLVREGRWTIDVHHEMARAVAADLDGNGVMDVYDRWGLVGCDMNTSMFFLGSGERFTRKDANDMPYLVTDLDGTMRALDIVFNLQFDRDVVQSVQDWPGHSPNGWEDPVRVNFRADRALFYTAGLLTYTLLRDMESPFGMVPMPMVFPEQQRFYTTLNPNNANTVAIPITVQNPDSISHVVEAVMAESRHTLRPAYFYVAMERQFMRDEESVEMLEIILESRMFDLIVAYQWGGLIGAVEGLTRTRSRDVASLFERLQGVTEAAIAATIEQFETH